MTHEEAVRLGLDMFYDGKSPAEIKRQIRLKGFSEIESANIFSMIEEQERACDNYKQNKVREHDRETREKQYQETARRLRQEKKARQREQEEEYSRSRSW